MLHIIDKVQAIVVSVRVNSEGNRGSLKRIVTVNNANLNEHVKVS